MSKSASFVFRCKAAVTWVIEKLIVVVRKLNLWKMIIDINAIRYKLL